MSGRPEDPELRARFQELKQLDAGQAPSFAELMARAQGEAAGAAGRQPRRWQMLAGQHQRTRPWLRRYGWAGGLAAAAAIAALIVIPRTRSNEDAFVQAVQSFQSNPALAGWRAPTDALLDLPGGGLMSTIPRVSSVQQ
jgi:hypothetical protein